MNSVLKTKIITSVKRFRFLYYLYYGIMTFLINIIKIFVKTDEELILFVSFGGRRYSDSPKAIYEYMRNDSRFCNYRLTWGFINPEDFPEIDKKVKIDTFKYYITSLKARCWVTNVSILRGLNYSGKHTFYLYTGHGSPIKKCGSDVSNSKSFKSAAKSLVNACLAQSEFEKEIRSRLSSISQDNAYLTGIPTNDILVNCNDSFRKKIRNDLGIDNNKKAILYAPTFREYRHSGVCDMPVVDFDKWHDCLGDEFVLLYRAHPEANATEMKEVDWFIDVTGWNDIEPLMIASDILVSDYSGLITDYSIMHKPIYLWTYDYEEYDKVRGLYFDIREVLPYAEKEDKLLSMIKEGYTQEQVEMLERFQHKYATEFGSATSNAVNLIFNAITKQ